MKVVMNKAGKLVLMFLSLLTTLFVQAQEKGADINVDINKDSGGGGWYTNPIIWIVGAAVFILLLVALLRGNSTTRD